MKRLLSVLFICLFCFTFSSQAAERPRRIVSMSLCSDELILRLADRDNIASLSYLSADPVYSNISADVSDLHLNRGRAEEVIPLQPDLIVSSTFSATNAISLLRQLDYSVSTLGFPNNLAQTYTQIRELAELLDEPEQGEALVTQIQGRISEIQQAFIPQQGKSAVFYSNNGFSFGHATLRGDFLSSLGLRNVAADYGLVNFGKLPLEVLLESRPDFLLIDEAGLHDDKLAHPLLSHPALHEYFSEENIIVLPDKYFQCAGPSLLEAYTLMLEALGNQP